MFAGLGAARIRKLFEQARKDAPAIVFIDELDAVGAARSGHGFNREQDQTLNQLLVELDGFDNRDQVIVMAASNRLQDLDPALLRPGRFDRQILVSPPDLAGREAILQVHTRGKPLDSDVDLTAVARQTAGLTGADLANIANEAAIFAGRESQQRIHHVDFENAMERVIAGLQQRRVDDREGEADPRLPRGRPRAHVAPDGRRASRAEGDDRRRADSALGYTLNLPEEDRYLHTREEFIDWMKIALAGRAAEQVVFGRVTNGAANDLEKVTELARSMVFEYGMSEGVVSRTMRADNYALSEETKRVRDQEQARLTDDAYDEAVRLITKHRAALDRLARGAPREGDARPRRDDGAPVRRRARVERERDRRPGRSAPRASRMRPTGEAPPADSILLACGRRGSTIWASPSRTSTRRSTRTSGSSAPRSRVATRSSRRASRPWRSGWARAASSCSRPLGEDTPVGKFLAKRGPGMHHVAYEVDDLPQGLADLAGQGVHVIDDVPRPRTLRHAGRFRAS